MTLVCHWSVQLLANNMASSPTSFPMGRRPIAFTSRSLSQSEKNHSQIALALIYGVCKYAGDRPQATNEPKTWSSICYCCSTTTVVITVGSLWQHRLIQVRTTAVLSRLLLLVQSDCVTSESWVVSVSIDFASQLWYDVCTCIVGVTHLSSLSSVRMG